MRTARVLMATAALLTATAATAADPAPPPATSTEHRLSPEQIEKVLDEAARKHQGIGGPVDSREAEPGPSGTPIHGEVGFSIGTGGYRAAHGTAVIGLPDNGVAIISLGTQRLPDNVYFYPGW